MKSANKLSARERLIYQVLIAQHEIDVELLTQKVREFENNPKVRRSAVIGALKSLGFKIASQGLTISRVSKIGRGAHGRYRIMRSQK